MTTFAYFVTASHIKDNTPLNENVDDKLIKNAIRDAQEMYIQDIIGSALYDELQTQIIGNSVSALNITLLDKYIQPCLLNYTICEGALPLTYKFINKSISTRNAEEAQPIDVGELHMIEEKYRNKAVHYANKLKNYLKENATTYPLYTNYGTGYDVVRPSDNDILLGFYLPDDE